MQVAVDCRKRSAIAIIYICIYNILIRNVGRESGRQGGSLNKNKRKKDRIQRNRRSILLHLYIFSSPLTPLSRISPHAFSVTHVPPHSIVLPGFVWWSEAKVSRHQLSGAYTDTHANIRQTRRTLPGGPADTLADALINTVIKIACYISEGR